jgi:hypothetical protein
MQTYAFETIAIPPVASENTRTSTCCAAPNGDAAIELMLDCHCRRQAVRLA